MSNIITVLGQPLGKQRPRATSRNGFVSVYTPQQTINYETLINLEYRQQSGVFYEKDKQLKLNIRCFYEIPQSISNRKCNLCITGVIRPLVKPDVDNVAKTIMDALNGVAYADDKQIVELKIIKQYSLQPKLEFSLEEIKTKGDC